jgi:hypothetical protein
MLQIQAVFPIAGALLVLLEVIGAIFVNVKILPLGGTHISQMAVVFGLAFVVYEFMSVLH